MKKIFLVLLMAVVSLGANAQFEKGTHYANASLSGLGISYGQHKWYFGVEAKYGYYIADQWMLLSGIDFNHQSAEPDNINSFKLNFGGRFSWRRNGLYGQVSLGFEHAGEAQNYCHLTPEVGYTFYLNKIVSIEPALYYDMCLNNFSDGSRVGLKIGVGCYF